MVVSYIQGLPDPTHPSSSSSLLFVIVRYIPGHAQGLTQPTSNPVDARGWTLPIRTRLERNGPSSLPKGDILIVPQRLREGCGVDRMDRMAEDLLGNDLPPFHSVPPFDHTQHSPSKAKPL